MNLWPVAEQEQDTSQLPVHIVLQLEPHELELYDNKKNKRSNLSSSYIIIWI